MRPTKLGIVYVAAYLVPPNRNTRSPMTQHDWRRRAHGPLPLGFTTDQRQVSFFVCGELVIS